MFNNIKCPPIFIIPFLLISCTMRDPGVHFELSEIAPLNILTEADEFTFKVKSKEISKNCGIRDVVVYIKYKTLSEKGKIYTSGTHGFPVGNLGPGESKTTKFHMSDAHYISKDALVKITLLKLARKGFEETEFKRNPECISSSPKKRHIVSIQSKN